ncbi:MAG: hypothetical protein R3C26_18515 [Calditrichia bacterium]
MEDVAVQALKEGAYDYLRKPISPQELLTAGSLFSKRCYSGRKQQRLRCAPVKNG